MIIKKYIMKILKNYDKNNLKWKSILEEDKGPRPICSISFSFKIPMILIEKELNDRYPEMEFEDYIDNLHYILKKISNVTLKVYCGVLNNRLSIIC
jgi:hypothetical protein